MQLKEDALSIESALKDAPANPHPNGRQPSCAAHMAGVDPAYEVHVTDLDERPNSQNRSEPGPRPAHEHAGWHKRDGNSCRCCKTVGHNTSCFDKPHSKNNRGKDMPEATKAANQAIVDRQQDAGGTLQEPEPEPPPAKPPPPAASAPTSPVVHDDADPSRIDTIRLHTRGLYPPPSTTAHASMASVSTPPPSVTSSTTADPAVSADFANPTAKPIVDSAHRSLDATPVTAAPSVSVTTDTSASTSSTTSPSPVPGSDPAAASVATVLASVPARIRPCHTVPFNTPTQPRCCRLRIRLQFA